MNLIHNYASLHFLRPFEYEWWFYLFGLGISLTGAIRYCDFYQ